MIATSLEMTIDENAVEAPRSLKSEADSRAVIGRSPELVSIIESDVNAGSQSTKEDGSR